MVKDMIGDCLGYYELGDSYFWIAAHCDAVMKFAKPLIKAERKLRKIRILDAGCGYGSLIARMGPEVKITGLDTSWEACSFCRKNYAVTLTQASVEKMPFLDNTFDVIFATEVIEHIQNDTDAMKELSRILKPGGYLIATVPAFMCLWGQHDEKYGHVRRYTKAKFCKIARSSGFNVQEAHYFKFLLFLPLLLLRKFKRIFSSKSDDFYKISPLTNYLLHKILNLEIPISTVIDMPIGANLFVVLRKD